MKKKKFFICFVSIFLALSLGTGVTIAALSNDGGSPGEQYAETGKTTGNDGNETGDYLFTRPDIAGSKIIVKDPELKDAKSWVEYIDYVYLPNADSKITEDGKEYIYKFYDPSDYAFATVMDVQPYVPENLKSENENLKCSWSKDELNFILGALALGNIGVIASGGLTSGTVGVIAQCLFANMATEQLIANSPYYADEYFTGLSNDFYYSMDSISITIETNKGWQIERSKNMEYTYTTGGELKFGAGAIFASTELTSKAESALGYGVSFNEGQSGSQGISKSITFNARDDKEVKNVPWRLVEFTARVPVKVQRYELDGTTVVGKPFYISFNLLHGVVREFANGYIEHWNTGKLVYRADFFEGFYTATQLVNALKNKVDVDDWKGENK